jgi:DNA-directed RNA polymerase specialized sigma24 family protein
MLNVERHAVQHGVPEAVLAETADGKEGTARRGHFEHDLIYSYLPEYLARVDCCGTDVSFCRHAQGAYHDALRQRGRRERHRRQLWCMAPRDPGSLQEVGDPTDDESSATKTGPTYLAHWVPSPDQVHESLGFLEELERMLDPLDGQIAALIMKHGIVQGDRGEIAKLLSITPSRMTRAIHNIREAVVEILRRRGIHRP